MTSISYDKSKVAQLLAQGIRIESIAKALGKSPEWLQQEIDSNEVLQDAIAEASIAQSAQAIDETMQVKRASSMLVHRLQELAQSETSLVSAMKALTQMEAYLSEQDTTTATPKQAGLDLNINLLLQQSLSIDLDDRNAIMTINGRDLTTLASNQVEALKNDYLKHSASDTYTEDPAG